MLAQINIYRYGLHFIIKDSGSISKYNIIIKLPELGQSLLVGSMGIVFLNRIVKEKVKKSHLFARMLLILMLYSSPALLEFIFWNRYFCILFMVAELRRNEPAEILNILLVISVNVLIAVLVALFIKISIAKGNQNFYFFATLIYYDNKYDW